MTKLRETLVRALTTTLILKGIRGTRLIIEPNGKNVKDETIRSQAPKLDMVMSMGKVQRLDDHGS